jgi:serine/threonine protein kinase
LGDFGFSYITSDDGWTWKYWLGRGTEGYFAPESTLGDVPLSERSPPTSKSNVFQVGATMLIAMTGSEIRPRDEEGLRYMRNAK